MLTLALALAACGGDDDGDEATPKKRPASTERPAAPQCEQVAQPDPKPDGGAKAPAKTLDSKATYDVVVTTSCGDFTIRLDLTSSPKTSASFISLAESGFFDATIFHRIVPGFVIQGGDPTGTGTGGPGYSTRDKVPRSATYTKGVVAMAKAQTEPPGTAGSQFFVVTGGDVGLPPAYALLGRVVKGQDVVDAIGELGDPASGGTGTPLQPVVIEKTTVRRR
jgi:cyclophilin family peptidyl-prolyl cis-trans isomerase